MSVPPRNKLASVVPPDGSGSVCCWLHYWEPTSRSDGENLTRELARIRVNSSPLNQNQPCGAGVCLFSEATAELGDFLRTVSCDGRERIIAVADEGGLGNRVSHWDLLQAGASDVLIWSSPDRVARQVRNRLERWLSVDQLIEAPSVADFVVGKSGVWRSVLRGIVETARFSDAPALILGESGTGKEIVAHLIHVLDPRSTKRDLVVLDCSTVVPELSGSEFFGHERGAFTGAVSERDGAFALANGGTLFLDEIGELPLPLQAQLLRVVQEHTYKRVGGNTWHRTDFRLVCATNRDLRELIGRGEFRADLYYRIASFVCKLPALRERVEDIIPLAEHFLRQLHADGEPPELDGAVRGYLLHREYPGNVRDLRQVVSRLMYRYVGDGTITFGNIPPEERPPAEAEDVVWLDSHFERAIQRALLFGAGLKEIGRAAEEVAIRIATREEDGSLSRAARRLGVTDRALQLRRANRRQADEILPFADPSSGAPAYDRETEPA
jgi:transcriptional regulator with GAF, ATPase, and Fis domain